MRRVGVVLGAIVVLVLGATRIARAQSSGPVPAVLDVPGSVRSAGLHGAGAALVGDAGSVFYNPAGLATISHIALEGGYFRDASGAQEATGALAWRLRQFDLGGGIKYFRYSGDTTATGVGSGVGHEYLGVGSLVYRFGLFAFGASAKVLRQVTPRATNRAVGGDLGMAIAVFDIMALGFSVDNVSGNWDHQSSLVLPHLTRFGFTMNYVDPQETFRLLSTVEVQWPEGQDTRVVLGGEGGVVLSGVGVVGRLAYGTRPPGSGESRVSYGLSVAVGRLQLDYAYEPTGALGSESHRFGARITL